MTPAEAVALNLKDPLVRQFVENEIKKAVKPLFDRISQLEERASSFDKQLAGWVGNIQGRINRMQQDGVRAELTRRRIRTMLEEEVENLKKSINTSNEKAPE
jgi:regulator of replication initiation timing